MGDTTVQWSSYNKALMERGKVQFEFDSAFQEAWFEQEKGLNGQCYSDFAIQFCLILPTNLETLDSYIGSHDLNA